MADESDMSASPQTEDFRPQRAKPDFSLGPDGKPNPGGVGDMTFHPRGTLPPLTNAQRQQRWRDKHRPRKPRPDFSLGPDGKPITGGVGDMTFHPRGTIPPKTNAERQQAWRDRHRARQRNLTFDPPPPNA